MGVGIIGYGAYIPRYRIKAEEIARVWNVSAESVKKLVGEKSVPGIDEDATTMAVEASRYALLRAEIPSEKIEAVYVGSESHPYAVKPTASIVAEAIGATPNLTAADLEFACKAGTAGFQAAMGLIEAGRIEYGLVIGTDTSQGKPGDALEYTASAGAGAFILGKNGDIAEIEDTFSFTTDTPDFWRRDGEEFPRHAGRFTGDPAYFKHVVSCTQGILEKLQRNISDYDYFIFHQPNEKFPLTVAKILGIPKEKVLPGLLVPYIGNTYSGNVPLALAAVLDQANPGERILATSYGSGAGSDSFSILVKEGIKRKRNKARLVKEMIQDKIYIDYATYARMRKKIKGVE